jgi:hypothetical protein
LDNRLITQFLQSITFRDLLSSCVRFLEGRWEIIMNVPEWTQPAAYGAVGGAIALAIVGFTWGGWVTAGTAQKLANTASTAAVTEAMTPYCLEMAKNDPQAATVLTELKTAKGYNGRLVIEKAGWATPVGADKPNSALATACQKALAESES